MFIRKNLVNTQIKRNKQGKKVLMKTLGIFELHSLVDKTYTEFANGKSITKIFQEHSVAKKHVNDYKVLLINKFLQENNFKADLNNSAIIKKFTRFAELSTIDKNLDLGFIYCIEVNDKIKIGRSTDLLKRLASYRSHIGSKPVILATKFLLQHTAFEQKLIKKLSTISLSKEWFDSIHREQILKEFE